MEEPTISIKKMEVRRIERDSDRKIFKYTFGFMELDPKDKMALTKVI